MIVRNVQLAQMGIERNHAEKVEERRPRRAERESEGKFAEYAIALLVPLGIFLAMGICGGIEQGIIPFVF